MGGLRSLGRRGAVVGAAYLLTAATTVVVIVALRGVTSEAVLRQVLGAQFIAVLAAGLEPATTRALALSAGSSSSPRRWARSSRASAIKALVVQPRCSPSSGASPILRFRAAVLANTPLLCLAGFLVTDVRGVLDLEGRHASAIWLKQGGLAGGLAVLAVLAAMRRSCSALALLAACGRSPGPAGGLARRRTTAIDTAELGRKLESLLRDRRWVELGGGLADRRRRRIRGPGLRPAASQPRRLGGLFPALRGVHQVLVRALCPLPDPLRARRRRARRRASSRARPGRSPPSAGAIFVVVVGAGMLLTPGADRLRRSACARTPCRPSPSIAFAAAIAVNSLVQLRVTELQARGAARSALVGDRRSAR